ncbi:hypothetical protein LJR231_001556 [Phyllobacterium sp. LjRoot231]|uniref:hypothetical protein n=1 Tax=Phyllobacterium sp. LjRoot231 TaxID=3342289 RepID=UPI003ECFB27E
MYRNLALNRVIQIGVLLALLFAVLVRFVDVENLIVVLNSVFMGSMAAIMVAYWRLLLNAALGIFPFNRVRQMTLGFFLCWVAYNVDVLTSIYFRSRGFDMNSSMLTAAGRYVAIIAAVLQVTAPDFGLGLFHGRERQTLWTGGMLGLLIAILAIIAQDSSVLALQ